MGSPSAKMVSGAGLLFLAWVSLPLLAQDQVQGGRIDLGKAQYLGADACASCHKEPQNFSTDFVLLTEYKTWKERDKHAQAYQVLLGERARQMEKLLGFKVAEDGRCLNCHAINVPKARQGDNFHLRDGVNCEGCHGPAEGWLGSHLNRSWREISPQDKSKQGMTNFRDSAKRAEICTSCHVGSRKESKFISHDMYAAGHPPLPGFELDTFCENLPRHWRYNKEKKPEVLQKLKIDPDELDRVEAVVVGGVAVLRTSMELLESNGARLDYAQFDCYACHHELKAQSARPQFGYRGVPGRPSNPAWPAALVRLGIEAAYPEQEARNQLRLWQEKALKVQAGFDARLFGDAPLIATQAKQMTAWADGLIEKLRPIKVDQAKGRQLLRQLGRLGREEAGDYQSARQVAWALTAIYSQIAPKTANDARIRVLLDRLKQELDLDLPSGQDKKILEALPVRLRAPEKYDAIQFQNRLDELIALLPAH